MGTFWSRWKRRFWMKERSSEWRLWIGRWKWRRIRSGAILGLLGRVLWQRSGRIKWSYWLCIKEEKWKQRGGWIEGGEFGENDTGGRGKEIESQRNDQTWLTIKVGLREVGVGEHDQSRHLDGWIGVGPVGWCWKVHTINVGYTVVPCEHERQLRLGLVRKHLVNNLTMNTNAQRK